MMRSALVVAATVGLVSVAGAQAQKPDIPKDMVPPPGMCRVWIRAVPAKQQPAPTDCKTATKSKPPNADVIYGDDYVKKSPTPAKTATSGTPPAARGAAAQTATPPIVPPKRGGGGGGG